MNVYLVFFLLSLDIKLTGGRNKREDKFVTLYIVYKYQADYQIWNVGRFKHCKTLI